jgi:RimK family alpha-L-glutamate ligase
VTYSQFDLSKLDLSAIESVVGFPAVVKASRGCGGRAVFLVRSREHLQELTSVLKHDMPYVFQEYIEESHGRDLRVVVIGGEVVLAMMRSSADGSMRANLTQGGNGELVTGKYLEAESLAVRIAAALGMDLAGVDLLWSNKHGYVCCEVNNNFSMVRYQVYGNIAIRKTTELTLRRLKAVEDCDFSIIS